MRSMTWFVRDNIEAFAVAIAMALVIRHYSVEAFRIPTGSMMPALYGDGVDERTHQKRHGDRILVDKFAWMRGDPERYQVAVFQYPLDRNTNFIKRIAGLPDEWIAISDGDIWRSDDGETWTIARKSPALREELWIGYWPVAPDNRTGFSDDPCWECGDGWSLDDDTLAVEAAPGGSTVRFARDVLTYPEVDYAGGSQRGAPRVGDIRFRADVTVDREGELEFRIREHGADHRLVIGPDASFLEVGGEEPARRDIDFRVEKGATFALAFSNVDATLVARLDGRMFDFDFPDMPTTPPGRKPDFGAEPLSGDHGFSILSRGCNATFEDVRIDRDLHYLRGPNDDGYQEWQVPPEHFFMLGDNTNASKDSRQWRVYRLTKKDGETIEWEVAESSPNPSAQRIDRLDPDEEFVIPVDRQGLSRRVRRSDIAHWEHEIEWPFVPRDHLIGRAFGVFWPIYVPPIYRGPTRIQRIR